MKIVDEVLCLSGVFLLFALAACSPTVSQISPEITPITYRPRETSIERSVGKLRRLAIAPVAYECVAFFGYCTPEEVAEKIKKTLLSESISLLNDWKGYEAVSFDPYTNLLQENLELSTDQLGQRFDALADWAMKLSEGERPPTEVITTVSLIGRALNVDGLVFIYAFDNPNPFRNCELRAVIYEVSSGRAVWSKKVSFLEMLNTYDPKQMTEVLFDPLEHAIPKVLVEEKR